MSHRDLQRLSRSPSPALWQLNLLTLPGRNGRDGALSPSQVLRDLHVVLDTQLDRLLVLIRHRQEVDCLQERRGGHRWADRLGLRSVPLQESRLAPLARHLELFCSEACRRFRSVIDTFTCPSEKGLHPNQTPSRAGAASDMRVFPPEESKR